MSAWSGTDDDAGTELTNTLTMPPGLHFVTADYSQTCLDLTLGHTGQGGDPVATGLGNGTVWTRHHVASECDALGMGAGDLDATRPRELHQIRTILAGLSPTITNKKANKGSLFDS